MFIKRNRSKNYTYLKLFNPFCQALFNSTRIFTQRKIGSSPPLKSIPSCNTSPSYSGNALLSIPGALSLIWFKNVPLLDFTSFTNHCPLSYQNSQCRLDTTFDLNPTGEVLVPLGSRVAGWLSLSEYRPTRITSWPVRRTRSIGEKVKASRDARMSICGVKRMDAAGGSAGP